MEIKTFKNIAEFLANKNWLVGVREYDFVTATGIRITLPRNDIKTLAQHPDRLGTLEEFLQSTEADPKEQGGVKFFGKTTPDFREEIIDAYTGTPDCFRWFLENLGFLLAVGATGTDISPEFKDTKAFTVDEEDSREWINQSHGTYSRNSKLARICQFYLDGPVDDKQPLNPTINEIVNGLWSSSAGDTGDTVRHEIGHAIDDLANTISDSQKFIDCYEADLATFGPDRDSAVENAKSCGYGYFVRKNATTGRSEMFAELMAQALGGSAYGSRMAREWPNTFAFIAKFKNDFVAVHKHGVKPLMQYLGRLHNCTTNNYIDASNATTWFKIIFSENRIQNDLNDWINSVPTHFASSRLCRLLKNDFDMISNVSSEDDAVKIEDLVRTSLAHPKISEYLSNKYLDNNCDYNPFWNSYKNRSTDLTIDIARAVCPDLLQVKDELAEKFYNSHLKLEKEISTHENDRTSETIFPFISRAAKNYGECEKIIKIIDALDLRSQEVSLKDGQEKTTFGNLFEKYNDLTKAPDMPFPHCFFTPPNGHIAKSAAATFDRK